MVSLFVTRLHTSVRFAVYLRSRASFDWKRPEIGSLGQPVIALDTLHANIHFTEIESVRLRVERVSFTKSIHLPRVERLNDVRFGYFEEGFSLGGDFRLLWLLRNPLRFLHTPTLLWVPQFMEKLIVNWILRFCVHVYVEFYGTIFTLDSCVL